MTTALRHRFEIRQMRSGKYAIVVLDHPEHGTAAIVRSMPTVHASKALLNANWQDVQWESDTKGSFAEFVDVVTLYDPSAGDPVEVTKVPCRWCGNLADPAEGICSPCIEQVERDLDSEDCR